MFVRIEENNIYYEILNPDFANASNPFLVFLHHGLGSVKQWKDFPSLLSLKLHLPALVYDRIGYGLSSPLIEKKTLEHWAKDIENLKKLIDALKINNPLILFGHSDGGTLALMYAAKYPQNVFAVITEAHHIKIEDQTIEGIKEAIKQYENGNLREKLYQYHGDKTDKVFYDWADLWISKEALDDNLENLITQINAPILSIQGKNDEYGTEYQINIIKEKSKNPKTKTLLIENCKHFPHFEHTNTVITEVVKFINSLIND